MAPWTPTRPQPSSRSTTRPPLDPTSSGPRRPTSPSPARPACPPCPASCSPPPGRPRDRRRRHRRVARRLRRRHRAASSCARRRRARTAPPRRWPACSTRVLDVADEADFLDAVEAVLASAERARAAGLVDADMADARAADARRRLGRRAVRRRSRHRPARPPRRRRRRRRARRSSCPARSTAGPACSTGAAAFARSAPADGHRPPAGRGCCAGWPGWRRTPPRTYGGPQDIEWAVDGDGDAAPAPGPPDHDAAADARHRVRARPGGRVLPRPAGAARAGPLARPAARRPARGAAAHRHVARQDASSRSPLVVAVDGMAAADLGALGARRRAGGDAAPPRPAPAGSPSARRVAGRPPAPRPPRAGRPTSSTGSTPTCWPCRALDELGNHELLAVLRNGRRTLVSLHGHEALAGLLIPDADAATVTGASLALSAIAQARAEGITLDELVERDPVVLALVPPRIGPTAAARRPRRACPSITPARTRPSPIRPPSPARPCACACGGCRS